MDKKRAFAAREGGVNPFKTVELVLLSNLFEDFKFPQVLVFCSRTVEQSLFTSMSVHECV